MTYHRIENSIQMSMSIISIIPHFPGVVSVNRKYHMMTWGHQHMLFYHHTATSQILPTFLQSLPQLLNVTACHLIDSKMCKKKM